MTTPTPTPRGKTIHLDPRYVAFQIRINCRASNIMGKVVKAFNLSYDELIAIPASEWAKLTGVGRNTLKQIETSLTVANNGGHLDRTDYLHNRLRKAYRIKIYGA